MLKIAHIIFHMNFVSLTIIEFYLLFQLHPFFRAIKWDDLYSKKVEPPFKPSIVSLSRFLRLHSKTSNNNYYYCCLIASILS